MTKQTQTEDPAASSETSGFIVWGRAEAYSVKKVVWAAEEIGHPYRRIDAGRSYGVVDTPEFLKLNPNGLIPVLQDGDFILWESHVIVRYLCARYGGDLYPRDLQDRMGVERWMDWESATVYPPYRPALNVIGRGGNLFPREVAEAGLDKTMSLLAILDAHLADRAYVGGDRFTMGDIPVGALVNDIASTIDPDLRGMRHLKRWHDSVTARPAAAVLSFKPRPGAAVKPLAS